MDTQSGLPEYSYAGARAMVILHERHLRSFLATWKRAKAAGVVLPVTTDPSYVSLEAVLAHVCRAARGYMTWMCDVLDLPDPGIRPAPTADTVEADVDEFVEHLLERWRTPLASVTEDRFEHPEFDSRWKTKYCIDAMLEHAVMHPIRHEFQLAQLLAASASR